MRQLKLRKTNIKYSVPQLGAKFEILDTQKFRVVKKLVNGRRRVSGLRLLRRGG